MSVTTGKIIMAIYGVLAAVIMGLCLYASYLSERVDALKAENTDLVKTLDRKAAEATATSEEIKKLSADLANLLNKAMKGEDKLNNAIKKNGDSCLNAAVSADVLDVLRDPLPVH